MVTFSTKENIKIMDKNWTEKMDEMTRERLERFAANAMGFIMTTDGHTNQMPDEVFDWIYEIGENEIDE